MKKFSLYGFCRTALWGLSLVALLLVFGLNFFYNATVSYDAAEQVTIARHVLPSVIMLLAVLVLTALFVLFKDRIEAIDPKWTFRIFACVYAVMALYWILNVDSGIRADARTVFYTAQDVANGDFRAFEAGGYIDRYPHQTGLMFYDSILQLFGTNPAVSFVANFGFVLGINFLTVRIAEHLFHSRAVTLLTTLLAFAFLPQFLFILFAYGLIPGFFFMMLAFCFALRFGKTKRVPDLILTVLGAALAVCLKQNFLIGAIAIAIYLLLCLFRERGRERLKPLAALCVLLVCLMLPTKLITLYYEEKSDRKLDGGTPAVLWVAMGTDMHNDVRGPGWYNSFNFNSYTRARYDSEKAAELGIERLEENLREMRENPKRAVTFFTNKTISQWCEPMYQSVWSGPLEDCNQFTHTELLRSIYTGGAAERSIASLSKALIFLIFGFTFVCLLMRRKNLEGWELFLMFLIGGLLFHTAWEGKSQYIYPYVFCLIPLAAGGMGALADGLRARWKGRKTHENE